MTMLIEDPWLEEKLKEQRRAWGSDHHDEVWEGVYFMAPLPDNEHQEIIFEFSCALRAAIHVPGLGDVLPGVNIAASADDWEHDYRVQDVIVFMAGTAAENHHDFWTGAADFVIEITTPGDRTYEKMAFYSRIGVRELLIVNHRPWALELYRHQAGSLRKAGQSTLERPEVLSSEKLPLEFRLIAGEERPRIEVRQKASGERWVV